MMDRLGMILALFSTLGFSSQATRAETHSIRFPLLDLHGNLHAIHQNPEQRLRVFVFLSTECPISNSQIQTLNQLSTRLDSAAAPVDFFGVVSDRSITRAHASQHSKEYKILFPVLFDSSGSLQWQLRPTHVPEAFVLNPAGEILYRGAIDNTWQSVGKRRLRADREYLSEAILAHLANKPIPTQTTAPVGCPVEGISSDLSELTITYSRDIAPIVQSRCASCHHERQSAPFALGTYEAVAERAKQITRVTHNRIMPPWPIAMGTESFLGDRRLTDRELTLIRHWATTGCRKGDEEDLPPQPREFADWRLGPPDLILKMPRVTQVPATGADLMRQSVISVSMPEDKLVAAMEFRPGNPRVVRRATVSLQGENTQNPSVEPSPRQAKASRQVYSHGIAIGAWASGDQPRFLPDGMGRSIKKGSKLLLEVQYHPSGKEESDQSEIGLYFIKQRGAPLTIDPSKIVESIRVARYDLAALEAETSRKPSATYTLPRDGIVIGLIPNKNSIGKAIQVSALFPDRTTRTLLDIPNWDGNWPGEYLYQRAIHLPAGTQLRVEATLEPLDSNRLNGKPERSTASGKATIPTQMLGSDFLIRFRSDTDRLHTLQDNRKHDSQQPRPLLKE